MTQWTHGTTHWRQWFATAAVLLCGLASAAGAAAADLGLDPSRFFIQYEITNTESPVYQVLPSNTDPFPFNDAATPFLLPCHTQNFGGQLRVASAGPDAVYPQVTIRFFRTNGNIIVSDGFSGIQTFDHLNLDLSLLPAGESEDAGFTPISSVSVFRDFLFQIEDFPANQAVRMELTVYGFTDVLFTQPAADPNPANDTMNFWIRRSCP